MPISTVTSEALQLKLRQLLPSQQGFGTDLSASDTIIPIIDLTAAAEGSDVRESLQTALAFGSVTAIAITNTTGTVVAGTGFFRFTGTLAGKLLSNSEANISITDGAATKIIFGQKLTAGSSVDFYSVTPFDLTVFLRAGDTLQATTSNSSSFVTGSVRQVADLNGTLVQPVGFTPQ